MSRLRTSLAALACALFVSGLLKAGDPRRPRTRGGKRTHGRPRV
jgi:hypothetical protein